jgi:hypothetical protein
MHHGCCDSLRPPMAKTYEADSAAACCVARNASRLTIGGQTGPVMLPALPWSVMFGQACSDDDDDDNGVCRSSARRNSPSPNGRDGVTLQTWKLERSVCSTTVSPEGRASVSVRGGGCVKVDVFVAATCSAGSQMRAMPYYAARCCTPLLSGHAMLRAPPRKGSAWSPRPSHRLVKEQARDCRDDVRAYRRKGGELKTRCVRHVFESRQVACRCERR